MTDNVNWRALPAGELLDRIIWRRLGGDDVTRYPAFSTDANAALTLWDEQWQWGVSRDADGSFRATFPNARDNDGMKVGSKSADTPALAICRAWLAWMDEKEAKA